MTSSGCPQNKFRPNARLFCLNLGYSNNCCLKDSRQMCGVAYIEAEGSRIRDGICFVDSQSSSFIFFTKNSQHFIKPSLLGIAT